MFKKGDKVKIKENILQLYLSGFDKVGLALVRVVTEGKIANLFTVIEIHTYNQADPLTIFNPAENGVIVKESGFGDFIYPASMFELYNPWKQQIGE